MALDIAWEDVQRKYPELGTSNRLDERELTLYHIPYGIAELESRLSSVFATPFDGNNLTAKDLSIDLIYLRIGLGKFEKADLVRERVDKLIADLIAGEAAMVYDDGTTVRTTRLPGATHEGYSQTFGMGDIRDAEVSETWVAEEEAERN